MPVAGVSTMVASLDQRMLLVLLVCGPMALLAVANSVRRPLAVRALASSGTPRDGTVRNRHTARVWPGSPARYLEVQVDGDRLDDPPRHVRVSEVCYRTAVDGARVALRVRGRLACVVGDPVFAEWLRTEWRSALPAMVFPVVAMAMLVATVPVRTAGGTAPLLLRHEVSAAVYRAGNAIASIAAAGMGIGLLWHAARLTTGARRLARGATRTRATVTGRRRCQNSTATVVGALTVRFVDADGREWETESRVSDPGLFESATVGGTVEILYAAGGPDGRRAPVWRLAGDSTPQGEPSSLVLVGVLLALMGSAMLALSLRHY